jgi:hypothetical protein
MVSLCERASTNKLNGETAQLKSLFRYHTNRVDRMAVGEQTKVI